MRSRLEFLSTCFGIEVCGYAILTNHAHTILRVLQSVGNAWSDEEVARRWLRLFTKERDESGNPLDPTKQQLEAVLGNPGLLATYRSRLNSISWFMKSLNEWISRKANREDNCTGKFWEGRFKCTALRNQGAVLACMQYVDLNPIRAGLAESLDASEYTSAQDRIKASQAREALKRYRDERDNSDKTTDETLEQKTLLKELVQITQRDSWLSPINEGILECNKPFLNMKLEDYFTLLDWTGRKVVEGKKGSIPRDMAPLLERMELNTENWFETVQHFGSRFYHIAGPVKILANAATRLGLKWMKGKTGAKAAFS
jgi:REP element-mobilizing transposase RayT